MNGKGHHGFCCPDSPRFSFMLLLLSLIINGLDPAGFKNSFSKRLLFGNLYHCKGNGPAFNGLVFLQTPFENKRKPLEKVFPEFFSRASFLPLSQQQRWTKNVKPLKAIPGNRFFNFTLDAIIEYRRPWICPQCADKQKLFCAIGKAQFCNFRWIDKINFIKCFL